MISAPRTVSELLALINPNPPLSSSSSLVVPSPDAWKLRVELQASLNSAEGQHYFTKVSCGDSIASSYVWQPDRYIFNRHAIDHVHVKSEKRSPATVVKTEGSSGDTTNKKKSDTKKRWYSVTTSSTTVTPTEVNLGLHKEQAEKGDQMPGDFNPSYNEASGESENDEDEDSDSEGSCACPPARKRPKRDMNARIK